MASTAVVHDHFVLLLNNEEFENLPQWLTNNFNVVEGGTHTKGSSRNKLIVFKDGTYLELFNWIKEPAEFLDWADKQPGLIDFAITTMDPVSAEQNHETVQSNLSKVPSDHDLGVTYTQPAAGARKRADGKEVKWKSSRPTFQKVKATPDEVYFPKGRIDVPFFCHDVTERTTRVPFDNEEITTHPCGAVGIDNIQILVPESHIDAYLKLYGAILDVGAPQWLMDNRHDEGAYFRIGVPNPIDSRPAYVAVYPTRHYKVTYSSASPDNPPDYEAEDQAFLKERGIGIKSMTLRTAQQPKHGHDIGSFARHGIGRTIHLNGWLSRSNAEA